MAPFLKRFSGRKFDLFSSVVLISLLVCFSLLVIVFCISRGVIKANVYEALAWPIVFIVHFFTIAVLMKIKKNFKGDDYKTISWFLVVIIWLLVVDILFYIGTYAGNSYLLQPSFIQFLLYYAPCIVYCFIMIVFLSRILLKGVLPARGFIKIVAVLIFINAITISLFLLSIHYAFSVLSWQIISQVIMLSIELVLFDFSILALIYANSGSLLLLCAAPISLVAGDFFITYSYISQTTALLLYGQLLWVLGLFLFLFAVLNIRQNKNYCVKTWFRKANGIRSRLAFWAFSISISGFLFFFLIVYMFSLVSKEVFVGLPLYIMLYSVIVVVLSIWMGANFEAPFKKIAHNIEILKETKDKARFDDNFSTEEFIFLQKFIIDAFEFKEEKDHAKKELGEIAAQVAHDIRSPLAALNTCLKHLPQVPENQRVLMRNAANRINDIANNLLRQYKTKEAVLDEMQRWLLAPLVGSIVSEKRLQFEEYSIEIETDISSEGLAAFAKFDGHRMKRLLSNLINNSAEAFAERGGKIVVTLDANAENIFLKIKDNGCGIPEDQLAKILEPGVSFKEKGSGLGLSYANEAIAAFGGALALHSTVGQGTTVDLILPRALAPNWFLPKILVSPEELIAILDDDQSVHDAWDQRLLAVSKKLQIHHFRNSQDLIAWYQAQAKPVQVFSDYELLNDTLTGLEVLGKLSLGKNAILVTSHYENPDIIKRCVAIGAHLLPKNLLAHIPIGEEAGKVTSELFNTIDFDLSDYPWLVGVIDKTPPFG